MQRSGPFLCTARLRHPQSSAIERAFPGRPGRPASYALRLMVFIHLSMGFLRVVKAKSWVVKEFESGQREIVGYESVIEGCEGIQGW